MNEASQHDENSFITLTYDERNLPSGHSLSCRDLQLFFKRLRKQNNGKKILYFGCGEYGDRTARPHYHVLLFGLNFFDRRKVTIKNAQTGMISEVTKSPTLEKIWGLGLTSCDDVTFESCAYVARYCLKKISGEKAKEHYGERVPEFMVCSKRPAIAQGWYEKYQRQIMDQDEVLIRGFKSLPPRYFDKLTEKFDPDRFFEIKKNRERHAQEIDAENQFHKELQKVKLQRVRFEKKNRGKI